MRITNWHLQCIYFAAVFTCVAILAMRGLVRWRERRRMRSGGDVARCGRCGYLLVAGASVICSECGNDVRRAGLVSSHTVGRTKLGPAYVLAGLVALAAVWCGPRLAEWQPFGWIFSVERFIYPQGDPQKVGYAKRLVVMGSGSGRYFARETGQILVYGMNWGDLPNDYALVIHAPDLTLQVVEPGKGWRTVPFDREVVSNFLDQFGGGIPPESRGAVLERIVKDVREIAAGEFSASEQYDPVTSDHVRYSIGWPARATVATINFFLLTASLCLCVSLLSRRMRARQNELWILEAKRLGLVLPLLR